MILVRILLVVIIFFVFLIPASSAQVITNLTITPPKAYTINDLTCSFVVTGSNDTYGANISWYVRTDGSWSLNSEENKSCSNNTLCSSVLDSSNTVKGQTWNCSITAYNATSSQNSTTKAISNSPPDFDPVDTYFNANESQFFSKVFSATDYDSDDLTYFIKSTDIDKVEHFSCFGGSANTGTAEFSLDNSTGNLTFNASRGEVGNYTIGISTRDNDTSPITTTLFVNFSINCVYSQPTLDDIENQTIEFNKSFSLQLNYNTANDADNLTFESNATFFNISSSGLINFTANNSNDVGEHVVNVSMNDGEDQHDPGNYSSSRIVHFIIVKPPLINWTNVTVIEDNNETSVNDTAISAAENTMSILFNSSSYDDPSNENITGYGNLTYQWKLNGTVMSNNQSWLFEPDYGDEGFYNVTLEVSNYHNITVSRSWNLTINKTYRNPLFKPYLRPRLVIRYGNQTITLQNSSVKDTYVHDNNNYGNNETLVVNNSYNSLIQFNLSSISSGINITEAILFLYLLSGENTSSNVTVYRITSHWEENEATWANRTANATWSNSGGDYNGTAIYARSVGSVYSWYNWTVTDLVRGWYNGTFNNTGMILIGSVQKNFPSFDYKDLIPGDTLTENVDKQTDIYLNQYFFDLDGENLTYNYSADSSYLDISISNDTRVVYRPSRTGTTYLTFSAKNPGNETAESNSVTLVIEASPGEQSPTVTVSTWQTTTVEHITKASLDIVISPLVSADPSSEVIIPFKLENSGELVLNDIDLSIESRIPNASIRLSDYSFDEMFVDEIFDVNLTLITRDIEPERYNITIRANVSDPEIEQSTMVYIDILKIGKEMQKEVLFAKDLFEENPECFELIDTLDIVQDYIDKKDYDRALGLVRSSIENCKALIKYKETEVPSISPDLIRNLMLIL